MVLFYHLYLDVTTELYHVTKYSLEERQKAVDCYVEHGKSIFRTVKNIEYPNLSYTEFVILAVAAATTAGQVGSSELISGINPLDVKKRAVHQTVPPEMVPLED